MPITKNAARQSAKWAFVDINLADVSSAALQAAIELPERAIVVGGFVQTLTPFNAGTSATLKIGDALDDDRYGSIDVKTGTLTALTCTGFVTASMGAVTVTYTAVGTAATAGKARLFVEYIAEGRAESTQG